VHPERVDRHALPCRLAGFADAVGVGVEPGDALDGTRGNEAGVDGG
jgi:hypothetical protein